MPLRSVALTSLVALALLPGSAWAQQEATDAGAPAAVAVVPDQRPLTLTRAQVRRLQRALGVGADGRLGAQTRTAVRRFERGERLAVDGRPDPEVLGRLGIDLTPAQVAQLTSAVPAAPTPLTTVSAAQAAVAAARAQIGTPYARAGAAPGGFDCSGLTSWAYAQQGVSLPHSSFAQAEIGAPVETAAIQPGDLVLFDTAGPGASDVGIATSATTVISATTKGVREHPLNDTYWGGHLVGARRLAAPPA